jgi:transcriptional regulator with XRE-family HTH domain
MMQSQRSFTGATVEESAEMANWFADMATHNRTGTHAGETAEARVRRRLRELRLANGLSLREVAGRAHLDVSTLSRLESGKRRLVLDHLPPLADALGVSTDELLSPPDIPDPRVTSRPIRRNGLTMWPLNRIGSTNRLQTYKVHIPASRRHLPATLPVHDGHDWMYVLTGRMRLVLGDEDLIVEPGQAVEFTTTTPHWFGAIDGPVEILAVFGPHGERAHLDQHTPREQPNRPVRPTSDHTTVKRAVGEIVRPQ